MGATIRPIRGRRLIAPFLAALLALLTTICLTQCGDGSEASRDFGVLGLCERMADCCGRIDDKSCALDTGNAQTAAICETQMTGLVGLATGADSPICHEWYDFQAAYAFCLGDANMTCDEFFDPEREPCSEECRSIIQFDDSYNVDDCGTVVEVHATWCGLSFELDL